jgi:hypothetical protein
VRCKERQYVKETNDCLPKRGVGKKEPGCETGAERMEALLVNIDVPKSKYGKGRMEQSVGS